MEKDDANETMEKKESSIFILVDTSYWIFYRYFAIMQWWKHAYPDIELFEDPYENKEFVEKFTKTFLDSCIQKNINYINSVLNQKPLLK